MRRLNKVRVTSDNSFEAIWTEVSRSLELGRADTEVPAIFVSW